MDHLEYYVVSSESVHDYTGHIDLRISTIHKYIIKIIILWFSYDGQEYMLETH